MGKKANGGPGGQNNGKPTPVPNKEIIQRMNFLHQAATLISGALKTPLPQPSTSKLSNKNTKITSEERDKRKKTTHNAKKLAASGQLIQTQTGATSGSSWLDEPAFPDDVSESPSDAEFNRMLQEAKARRRRDLPRAPGEEKVQRSPEEEQEYVYVSSLERKGFTEAQIKVKLNQRKQRYLRKRAKASTHALEVGNASYDDKAAEDCAKPVKSQQRPKHPSQLQHPNLAAHYVNDIRTMAKKSVLRIDPSVKRTMCRNCNALLIPGVTSSVKILPSKSHVHLVRTKCLACNVARSIPSPPVHPKASAQNPVVIASAAATMQEDQTSNSASVSASASAEPSTSRTLSEASGEAEGEVSMQMEENALPVSETAATEEVKEPATSDSTKESKNVVKKIDRRKRHPSQRKKRHADPIVPGTRKQYTNPRFHEQPENVVIQVMSNPS